MYKHSKTYTCNYLSCTASSHYLANYMYHKNYIPKFLILDLTPQIIQISLIRAGFEYKLVKKYNVYIKAKLNIPVSRNAYNKHYKEAFRIQLI